VPGATGRQHTFDRLGRFLSGQHDPADFALRLAVGLGREVSVPMRLADMAFEELTEAMNRGWGTRNSTVAQLLQVERSGIEPPAVDPKRVRAILDAHSKSKPDRRSVIHTQGTQFVRSSAAMGIIRFTA